MSEQTDQDRLSPASNLLRRLTTALTYPRKPIEEVSVSLLRQLVLFLAFIVGAIILTFCYFAPEFCISIVLSVFLAVLLDPIVMKMERVRLTRTAAAGIVVICGFAIFLLLAFVVYQRASSFAEQLPQYSSQLQRELSPVLKAFPAIKTANWASFFLRGIGSIRTLVIVVGTAPFLVFFMLVRKDQMYYRAVELLESSADAAGLVNKLNNVLQGVAFAYLIVGSAMAVVCCTVFALLGLRDPLILGIISGYVNLVPYIGAIVAIVLPLAASMRQFSTLVPAGIIIVTILVLHLVTANVVSPRWIGPRVQIGPAAVLAGMLFWGWLWGIFGIILAVPLTASLKVVADQHPRLTYFSDLLADHLDLSRHGPGKTPSCKADDGER